jgi:hypothetical protein
MGMDSSIGKLGKSLLIKDSTGVLSNQTLFFMGQEGHLVRSDPAVGLYHPWQSLADLKSSAFICG